MKTTLENIVTETLAALSAAGDSTAADAVRVSVLGKKGKLTGMLRLMGGMDPSERPIFGQMVNDARRKIEQALEKRLTELKAAEREARLAAERIDVTEPGRAPQRGSLHPLTLVQRDLEDIFIGLGFSIAEGPEVELDKYNFELLNLPKNHPARDMQDTFFVSDSVVLRTHTSPVQARHMLNHKPPIRIICPGRVYRVDEMDATHSPIFHQMEGLVVDKDIRMADLRGVLEIFARELFGERTKTKFRPSFFPFTEPSAEMDATCAVCGGDGCRVCKGTGWIELLGCGMVNPKVLSMCGIDPGEYTGFAFGMGLDRIATIRYGIDSLRLLWDGDVRFLKQF
ncbi:MAG: phenylalanine--tRNA ligase subunit alpha [Christensenellales bacterium]|jgi:phenylalanyl-tRNA synthetase alpha chain